MSFYWEDGGRWVLKSGARPKRAGKHHAEQSTDDFSSFTLRCQWMFGRSTSGSFLESKLTVASSLDELFHLHPSSETYMVPENYWLVEENNLPGGHCQGEVLVIGSVN